MVATVRCEEIGNEKLASFTADEVIIVHIIRLNGCCIGSWNQLTLYIFICNKRNGNNSRRLFKMTMYQGLGRRSAASLIDVYQSEFSLPSFVFTSFRCIDVEKTYVG
jgi:hypothetical protein